MSSSSKEETSSMEGSQASRMDEDEDEGSTLPTETVPTEIACLAANGSSGGNTGKPNPSSPNPRDEKSVLEILVKQGNITPCVDNSDVVMDYTKATTIQEASKAQETIDVGVAIQDSGVPVPQDTKAGITSVRTENAIAPVATTLHATESTSKNPVPHPPVFERSSGLQSESTPGAFALRPLPTEGGTTGYADQSSSNEEGVGASGVEQEVNTNNSGSSNGEAAVERATPMNQSGENLIEARAVDDVVEVQAKPIEWWTPQKIGWVIAGTLTVLIIIIAVAVSVVNRNQNNSEGDQTDAPTLPPEERLVAITNVLLTEAYSANYTNTARRLLEDPESPQFRALQWIALEDEYYVPSDDVQHLIQRYSLGVLYYSTSGETWMESFEFLEAEHECSWSGALTCGSGDGKTVTGIALSENALAGRLPAEELGFLRAQLQTLDLANNEITGTLPPAMTQLTHLNLGRNTFTGTIHDEYQSMVMLEHMDMKMNFLNGTIPQQFGALTKLTILDIESNYLTGSIPDSMWDLTSLDKFIIESQVKLEGTISPRVGLWKNVTVFLVNMNNGLTGSIPTEVGLLTNLVEFKTAQNHMRGTIPSEMGLLTNLKFLAFSRNGYNGTLPSELAGLTNLHQMYIQSTWLTGEMVEFCEAMDSGELPMLKTLIADQQEVNCTCCTCCKY